MKLIFTTDLHGHIHESPRVSGKWHNSIGRTTCIQPGQGPEFTYVIIDTDTGDILHHPLGRADEITNGLVQMS